MLIVGEQTTQRSTTVTAHQHNTVIDSSHHSHGDGQQHGIKYKYFYISYQSRISICTSNLVHSNLS